MMRWLSSVKLVGASAAIGVLLTSARSLLVLRLLGPSICGIWKSVMLLYLAAAFVRLGVARGMALELPRLEGEEKHDEADAVAGAAGYFLILAGLAAGASLLIYCCFVADPQYRVALLCMAGVVCAAQFHQFLRDLAVARRLFPLRSKEILISSGVDFGASILLAWLFGLPGIGIGTLAAICMPAAYLWRSQSIPKKLKWDWQRLKKLIRIGSPASILDSTFNAVRYADVMVMAPVLGPLAVGHYSVSLLVNDFSLFLTRIGIAEVVSPNLMNEYGRTGSTHSASLFYEVPCRIFSYGLPPILGIGAILLPDFIHLLLPQYVPGIAAGQITIWGIFFLAVNATIGSFLVACGRIWHVLILFLALLPVSLTAQYFAMKAGGGLEGFALVSLLALGTICLIELWMSRRACGGTFGDTFGFLFSLLFPLLVCMAAATASGAVTIPGATHSGVIGCRIAVLLLLYLPVFWVYESRFEMFAQMVRPFGLPGGEVRECKVSS